MPDLDAIAARHGVGLDAVRHLLDALARGHGRMAQFNHPDLGGQWSAGGMTMIGDMFNAGLKARVVALCEDLAPLATAMPEGGGSFQSQGLSGQGFLGQGFSGQGFSGQGFGGSWWPEGLGQPSTSGSQNDARYAVFPETRRLAIESGGRVTLYDTGDHRIGGVSQQQGSSHSLSFTSQHGPVRLDALPLVGEPGRDAGPAPQAAPSPAPGTSAPMTPSTSEPAGAPNGNVFGMIERLSELHRRGVLTEAEFSAKKTELLARL
jgi:Short C-terminal domain